MSGLMNGEQSVHRLRRLFLLACMGVAGFQVLYAQHWTVSYLRGLAAVRNENWAQAIQQLSSAIDEHPQSELEVHIFGRQYFDYFPYLYRGLAYLKAGEPNKARSDIQHENQIGLVPQSLRDQKAAQVLKECLDALGDQKQQGPWAEGMRLFNDEDYQGAIEKFSKVPPASPRYQDAQRYLGIAKDEQKKIEQAAAREKAAKARPPVAVAKKPQVAAPDTALQSMFRLAVAAYDNGTIRGAKRSFQELKVRGFAHPDLEKYLLNIESVEEKTLMGVTAYLEGEYTLAISQLTECSKIQSDNPHVYAFLAYSCAAKCLLTPGRDPSLRRAALDAFGRLRRISPAYSTDPRFVSPAVVDLLNGL